MVKSSKFSVENQHFATKISALAWFCYNRGIKPIIMKRILFLSTAILLSFAGMAQGKGKGQAKGKAKQSTTAASPAKAKAKGGNKGYNQTIWEGTAGVGKPSKNQPAKVREAFMRDYPNASNVVWSKYRGDWTATFGSGIFGTHTAVYHANGQRKDTRSVINSNQLPGGTSIWDKIFNRDRVTAPTQVVQVERPGIMDKIFRVAASPLGSTAIQYLLYNANGDRVNYDY
jgi:hypothetical protein